MPDIRNYFDADESLQDINVDLTGPETATFYAGDYSETDNGDGTYTYSVTHTVSSDGDYTFTLNTAADADGNNGASGQDAVVTVETGSTSTMIESFEDLNGWEGDLSGFSIESSPTPRDGGYLLRHTGDGHSRYTIETTEYNITSGNTYAYWGYADYLGGEQWVTIGYDQSTGEGLTCEWDFTNDGLELWDYDGGTYPTQFDQTSWSADVSMWYRFLIDFEDTTDGEITFSVDSGEGTSTLASVTVAESKYDGNTDLLLTMEGADDIWVSMDAFERL